MQSQQVPNVSWETMMRRRSSLSAPGRRLSLLSVDPSKESFLGLDDMVLHDSMNIFIEPFNPTLIDPSQLTFEHAQARKNSFFGGIADNANVWGGLQSGGDLLANHSISSSNNILGGLQCDGSLLTNNRHGNNIGMNTNFLGSMAVMQGTNFLDSTRNSFLGTATSSSVRHMRNSILGSMRNSLTLGSITPHSDRPTLKDNIDADVSQGTYSVADIGSLFPPFMMDNTTPTPYRDLISNNQIIPHNIYSVQGAPHSMVTSTIASNQVLVDTTQSKIPSESTGQVMSSRNIGPLDLDGDADDADDDDGDGLNRFKPFHEEKWTLRYKELLAFHSQHGHAAVPHTYPPNPQLARWVKRQRRQYKLCQDGKCSTMTPERLEMLSSVGFVWDSHDVNWREKLYCLTVFRKETGHCNVPSNYKDKKLATWVKCQRRQYKLYCDGKPSAMNPDRIKVLEKVGFEWEIRSNSARRQPSMVNGEDFSQLDEL